MVKLATPLLPTPIAAVPSVPPTSRSLNVTVPMAVVGVTWTVKVTEPPSATVLAELEMRTEEAVCALPALWTIAARGNNISARTTRIAIGDRLRILVLLMLWDSFSETEASCIALDCADICCSRYHPKHCEAIAISQTL